MINRGRYKSTCNLKQTLFILCTGELMQKKCAKSFFRLFQTVVDNIRNIPNTNPHKTTHAFSGYVHSWLNYQSKRNNTKKLKGSGTCKNFISYPDFINCPMMPKCLEDLLYQLMYYDGFSHPSNVSHFNNCELFYLVGNRCTIPIPKFG
jgi:hypothetical protein